MPRIFIRLSRLLSDGPPVLPALPSTGRNLIPQCLHREEINEIARVLLVVPVVPEVAITLAPAAAIWAIEVPPVPAIGTFFSAAA